MNGKQKRVAWAGLILFTFFGIFPLSNGEPSSVFNSYSSPNWIPTIAVMFVVAVFTSAAVYLLKD